MKVERSASQLSFQKAFLGDNSPSLSGLGSIKVSLIGEDGSMTTEAVFTRTAASAARLRSPAASIPAPCWLNKEMGILSDFG